MWRLGAGAQRASDAAQPCDQPGPGRVDGRTATMTATGRGEVRTGQCVSGYETTYFKLIS